MANFYAKYPAGNPSSASVTTVQGEGTAGTPVGGVLTVQGDAAGTPLPITGSITATNPSVSTTGAAVPASATYAGMSVSGNLTGLTGTANGLKVDGSAVTQPISAASLPLPSGATTEVTLSSINTKTPALGQAAMAASTPVVIASDQSAVTVSGTVAATQSGTWTVQPGNTANTTPWLATIAQGGNSATVSAGGALKVDASASTQPVSGTVAATQSGTWTVQPGNTANTTPWLVTGSGTAGTAASGVVTIQGIASMTAVKTDPSGLTAGTAAFQAEGAIAFGSITNSYATILTPSSATRIVQMRNNTNAAISVSFDAGTTTNYTLDAGDQVSFDLWANGLVMSTSAIQIKYAVGAPTSGSFRVNACH